MNIPAIAMTDVLKQFGSAKALDHVAFVIPANQLWCVMGSRGAGKTTLLRLAAGLLHPDDGAVHIFGMSTPQNTREIQAIIGYVPRDGGVYDDLTVRENVALHAALRAVPPDALSERIARVLGLANLDTETDCRAALLTAGGKRRLAIACALVAMPRLLLIDEPLHGLDPASRRLTMHILRSVVQAGAAVLFASADAGGAEDSDGVVLLEEGRLICQGRPADCAAGLLGRVRGIDVPAKDRHRLASQVRGMPGVMSVDAQRSRLIVLTDTVQRDLPWSLGSFVQAVPRLEDFVVSCLLESGGVTVPPLSFESENTAHPAGAPPAVEVRGVSKVWHGRSLATDVELTVHHGQIVALTGPSGAGKSLILRLLCGIATPTRGRVLIGGFDLAVDRHDALSRVGYVSSTDSPYPELTVIQNLRFAASARRLPRARRDRRIEHLLGEYGLAPAADVPSGSLPAALQWRLTIAAAQVHEPELLLFDEPPSDLGPVVRRLYWADIGAMAARGVGVLVAVRLVEDAQRCDAVVSLGDRSVGFAAAPTSDGEWNHRECMPG